MALIAVKREVAAIERMQVFRGANVKFLKLATSHCIPRHVRQLRRKQRGRSQQLADAYANYFMGKLRHTRKGVRSPL